MNKYNTTDGEADIIIEAESASSAAQEYVDTGDWPEHPATYWIQISTTLIGDDGEPDLDTEEGHTIQMSPEVPACSEDEHKWESPHSVVGGLKENPGVFGKGGGITSTEVCRHCGCYRIVDTWAQNPATGEQGLTSTEYQEADAESETWIESLEED